ncbi:hypothetical protein [Acinetobacter sp. YT-02]|uniref:hypothetical protein n=1 Tax=Acinetobacter TaxID=469 RepID=UPI000BC51861|nr:hypothetical protein [Acinetobacter sp. YT-02]AVH50204.1 hypothetical protein C3Y93_11715 [Acinetobacter sp. SWBY1]MCO8052834.1 hypothetical protein [Acinetobacter towneri]PCN61087.1 hypothetical protein CF596_03900 [Acinetobacter sp. YT-02]
MSAKSNICAVSIWSAVALLGCDDSQLEQAAVQKYTEQAETKRLTEVAGQATAPMQTAATEHHIPENHLTYVGRYTIQISCEDKFVMCESGKVDYILTLLPDGTAHRIFVNAGQISYDNKKKYRKDLWFYDEDAHQIVVARASGVNFYYNVDQDHNLIMDKNKIAIATENNREYFKSNPLPSQNYHLIRAS